MTKERLLDRPERALEYVMSGPTYLLITTPKAYENERIAEGVNDVLTKLSYTSINHDFSFLYNAYTEKSNTKPISEVFRESIRNVYTDSGGLQLISLGHDINAEQKRKVYEEQAKCSNYAMIFDEIPVIRNTVGKTQALTSVNSRSFEQSLLVPNAIKTAQNIQEQLDYFESVDAKTKAVLIIHGNTMSSMMQWFETIIHTLPAEYHERIGSIAISSAAIGVGPLEEVQKAIVFKLIQEKYNFNHLHLLGIGSYSKLIPTAMVLKDLVRDGRIRISYDSTTHAQSRAKGKYLYKSGKRIQGLGYSYAKIFHDIYQEMIEFYPDVVNVFESDRQFAQVFNQGIVESEEHFGDRYLHTMCSVLYNSLNIRNMIMQIEDCFYDDAFLFDKVNSNKDFRPLLHVSDIDSVEEYERWYQSVGQHMKASGVAGADSVSLGEFFS